MTTTTQTDRKTERQKSKERGIEARRLRRIPKRARKATRADLINEKYLPPDSQTDKQKDKEQKREKDRDWESERDPNGST